MKTLTWLLGVMVILLGLSSRGPGSSGWTAVWIATAVLWFFVGCGLGVMTLSKLVSGKMGAGLARPSRPGVAHSSGPKDDQA